MAIDVGQGGEDLDTIRKRALACGAAEAEVVDARAEFAASYCVPALLANALYMDKYPLVSALSRPLIVGHLARVAAAKGASLVAHGCTGKGNDQVRFEVGLASLQPGLTVLAPVRDCRHDQGQGHRLRGRQGPADRPERALALLDRPEPVGPRGRDRLSGRHLERPPGGALRLHLRPGRTARARRTGAVVRFRRAGRHRRAAAEPARDHHRAERPGRGAGHRAPGHGGRPARRHQEPGDLRGARRHRADRCAFRARERMPRARPGPVQAAGGAALVRAGLRRPVVLSAQARARRLHRRRPRCR